jgi:Zn ribbon nucleic-acid-binding protein
MIIAKAICPDCNGNGYIGKSKDADNHKDCIKCNNQGEIKITEKEIQEVLKTARLQ